ncbi:MAG: tyrosine-protein phosphatase [Candidatus Obscuribacterales bacterium]|nr:tyrosine-protein phosphatase [Candidatus Obscuribacterales bacterium]
MNLFIILLQLTIFCLPALAEPLDLKSYSITVNGHTYHDQSGNLPNFHQVHPFLYRGGEPTAIGLKQLADMGVKTIIDLRNPGEKKLPEESIAQSLGMQYINMPMSNKAPTDEQVKTFISTVEKAQADQSKGSVLVHCAHGSDRTGCMIGIWRVTHDKFTYDKAYKEMRKYYFGPKYILLAGAVQEASKTPTSR